MTDKFYDWLRNAGKLRRYIFFSAFVGKLIILVFDPPSVLSEKLLIIRVPYLIGLKLISAVFSGVIIVECIRILFGRLTTSWSTKKHFTVVLPVVLIFIAIQIIFAFPASSERYYAQGWLLAKKGDFEGAIKSLDLSIGLNRQNINAYLERGWVYRKLGDLTTAVTAYSKAIEKDPKYSKSYVGRGYVYYYMGNYEKALQDWKHAIVIDPSLEKDLDQWIKVALEKKGQGIEHRL